MLYVLYKFNKNDIMSENFESSTNSIDDWNAINQLAQISRQLMNNGTITNPGNLTVSGNLVVKGNITAPAMTGTAMNFTNSLTVNNVNILNEINDLKNKRIFITSVNLNGDTTTALAAIRALAATANANNQSSFTYTLPTTTHRVGVLPPCGPNQDNIGNLCYSKCPTNTLDYGAACSVSFKATYNCGYLGQPKTIDLPSGGNATFSC